MDFGKQFAVEVRGANEQYWRISMVLSIAFSITEKFITSNKVVLYDNDTSNADFKGCF
jgi:hypothetical protein